jgi:branched-chain amino acid transport system permease protein
MIGLVLRNKRKLLLFLIFLATILPFVVSSYRLRFGTLVYMYIVLALSWDLLGGHTGYPSFGNPIYFGISAYVTAILMKNLNFTFFFAFILAGVASAIVAVFLGFILLKLKGHSFAIATLGVLIVGQELASNIRYIGATTGMELPIYLNYNFFYYAFLALTIVCIMAYWKIIHSKLGVGLHAIREDEEKAEMLGIKIITYKTFAWTIAAFFTGLCGSLYAYWFNYIEPHTAFDMNTGLLMIAMSLLGGSGSIIGPVIGAIILEILIETIWNYFLGYHLIIIGLTIMVVVKYMPKGVYGFFKKREQKLLPIP